MNCFSAWLEEALWYVLGQFPEMSHHHFLPCILWLSSSIFKVPLYKQKAACNCNDFPSPTAPEDPLTLRSHVRGGLGVCCRCVGGRENFALHAQFHPYIPDFCGEYSWSYFRKKWACLAPRQSSKDSAVDLNLSFFGCFSLLKVFRNQMWRSVVQNTDYFKTSGCVFWQSVTCSYGNKSGNEYSKAEFIGKLVHFSSGKWPATNAFSPSFLSFLLSFFLSFWFLPPLEPIQLQIKF